MPAKPGRPPKIAANHVVAIATKLFAEKGFDSVTMDDVASAAGISRKGLFLHFPSKGDLIWHRSGPFVDRLHAAISAETGDSKTAVETAIIAGFADVDLDSDTLRRQILLHQGDSSVREMVENRSREWRAIISQRFRDDGVDDVMASIIAYGYWRVMWSAMDDWAVEGGDIAEKTARRLRWFAPVVDTMIAHGNTF